MGQKAGSQTELYRQIIANAVSSTQHDEDPIATEKMKRRVAKRLNKAIVHEVKNRHHQNTREMSRRLRQIRNGTLKGAAVTDEARLAAAGLVSLQAVDQTIEAMGLNDRHDIVLTDEP